MKKIFSKKFICFLGTLGLILLAANAAQAKSADKISVFHADGTVFSVKPLIFEENALPGDEFTRGFFVKKKDKLDQTLMMRFQRKLTAKENILARKISVRLKRVSDGKFLRLPNGRKEMNLSRLYAYRDPKNSDAFRFDEISGSKNSRHEYELIFAFDSKAGNRFQGKKTKFDLSVGIYSKPAGVCRECVCFWNNFCCHPQDWSCRLFARIFP